MVVMLVGVVGSVVVLGVVVLVVRVLSVVVGDDRLVMGSHTCE